MSLDDGFVKLMDAKRGSLPRSRWIEVQADPEGRAPVTDGRSPARQVEDRILAEQVTSESVAAEAVPAPLDRWGNPLGTVYDETDPRSWT